MRRTVLALFLVLLLLPQAAQAGYEEGERAYHMRQWIIAIAHLRPLADAGDPRAAFLLAKMYLAGNGVLPNAVEAMRLYRIAAERGNTDAMVSIGAIYQGALGYRRNYKLAAEWIGRAAKLGNPYAALLYGSALFQGDREGATDFAPDPHEAYRWFRIAATNNKYKKVKDAAEAAAGAAANRLKGYEVAQINKEVAEWSPTPFEDMPPMPEEVR